MNPLTVIYWTRALLGIVAALICTLFIGILGDISIFNGISIALLIYIISYYIYKPLFLSKVEKSSKLFSQGVGVYFLTWIVMFTLFFTLLGPSITITNPAENTVFRPGDRVTVGATITNQFGVPFSGAIITFTTPSNATVQARVLNMTEISSSGMYSATYNITSSDPTGPWTITVQALIGVRYRQDSVTVSIEAGS
jgi:hypothetical protein